jgi:hypothetical protein
VTGTEDSMLPVQRVDMTTSDVDVVSDAIGQVFAQHRMRIRRDTQAQMDGCLRSAAAGPLNAGLIRQVGMDYQAQADPVDGLLAAVVVRGSTTLTSAAPVRRAVHHRFPQHRLHGGEASLGSCGRPG